MKAHVSAAGSAQERAARRQFADIWSALDNFALYLDAEKDLELGFSAAYRADALPTELKTVLGSRTKSSALWQIVPDDAIVALAGRATGTQIVDVLLAFTPPEDRPVVRLEIEKAFGAIIGKANVPAMLHGVGPDWGVWVTRPDKAAWFPGLTAAVRVEGNPNAVAKTVAFYTQLAQFGYNRDHNDQVESSSTPLANGQDITTFTNESIFPGGFQPSYGLTDGHLVVSSSPARGRGLSQAGRSGLGRASPGTSRFGDGPPELPRRTRLRGRAVAGRSTGAALRRG